MDDIINYTREEIKAAEQQLDAAKMMIDKLKAAGEDVTALQSQYQLAKQRLERYKKAFGVK